MKRLRSRGGPWRRGGPPQVRQGEGGEEEGLRQVQVLEGVQGLPPGVAYGLEWVTVSLPVLYRGEGEDWSGGVAQGGEAGAQGPPHARVGNAKL
jgi:hypothetical protein